MKDRHIIKAKKQDNGLWGMPLACIRIDGGGRLGPKKELLRSAIIISIAESHPFEKFEIFNSNKDGFLVKLNLSGFKSIKYEEFDLVNEKELIWKKE